jgi:hypothetical protein
MSKEDWYFIVGTILALISLLGMDWKLVRGKVAMSNQKRQVFLLIVVAASLVSNIAGWRAIHEIYKRIPYADFQSPRLALGAIITYGGGHIEVPEHRGEAPITVDGDGVLSYKDDYKVMGVAFHDFGKTDMRDISDLSETGLYDIVAGDIQMMVQFSGQFISEFGNGARGTNYVALMIPKTVSPSQFATIRQAESMGAIVIGRGSGPP